MTDLGIKLFAVEWDASGKVAIIMRLKDYYLVSRYVRPEDAKRMICIAISTKIRGLVKQRSYQIRHGFTGGIEQLQLASIDRLNHRLTASSKWNLNNLPKYLKALIPDLREIAPVKGRHAESWRNIIIGLEMMAEQKEIESKIKALINESTR